MKGKSEGKKKKQALKEKKLVKGKRAEKNNEEKTKNENILDVFIVYKHTVLGPGHIMAVVSQLFSQSAWSLMAGLAFIYHPSALNFK